MPRLTSSPDGSADQPAGRRPRWSTIGAFGAAAILVACDAGSGPPTVPPISTAAPPASATAPTMATNGSSADPSSGAGRPSGSPRLDLEPVKPARLVTVTLVCERWGSDPPPSLVSCGDAARLAVTGLGAASSSVTRLDVGYGEWCEATDRPCGDRSAAVVWVVARTGPSDSGRLRIARTDTGDLAVWPPVPGPTVEAPAFDAPERRAPALSEDAPPDLSARDAFPLCGQEKLGVSEAFATGTRRCFLTAVLAGSAAELDSHATSTEGDAVLTVYRFSGSGAIRRWVHTAGTWSASACGIAPLDTPAVFEMAGVCVAVPP